MNRFFRTDSPAPRFVLRLTPALLAASLLAACGGRGDPTPTPLPPPPVESPTDTPAPAPTDTPAPALEAEAAQEAAAPESPLAAPESPLAQPESPLDQPEAPAAETPAAEAPAPAGGGITILSDRAEIDRLAAELHAEAPAAGKASVSGLLFSLGFSRVIPGTQFYLTKALEENGQVFPPSVYIGAQEDKGDVGGTTDSMGRFVLQDIEPGKYYLAVWSIYDWILAQNSAEDFDPMLIEVGPDGTLDLGLVIVNWP